MGNKKRAGSGNQSLANKIEIVLHREAGNRHLTWPPEYLAIPALKLSSATRGRDRKDILSAAAEIAGIKLEFREGDYIIRASKS